MRTTASTELVPGYLDVTRLAVTSFLARYWEPTLTAYTQDLKAYVGWCQTYDRDLLRVTRGELEMYVRHLESRGNERSRPYAPPARRACLRSSSQAQADAFISASGWSSTCSSVGT